jgi:hypothetical protein
LRRKIKFNYQLEKHSRLFEALKNMGGVIMALKKKLNSYSELFIALAGNNLSIICNLFSAMCR